MFVNNPAPSAFQVESIDALSALFEAIAGRCGGGGVADFL